MKQPRRKLTPHQRIMRAYERGTGVRLSFDDTAFLAQDDAISTRAAFDDTPEDEREADERAVSQPGNRTEEP